MKTLTLLTMLLLISFWQAGCGENAINPQPVSEIHPQSASLEDCYAMIGGFQHSFPFFVKHTATNTMYKVESGGVISVHTGLVGSYFTWSSEFSYTEHCEGQADRAYAIVVDGNGNLAIAEQGRRSENRKVQ